MPEVDVKIKGDDSDLKKKFEESAKQAKEFGDKIKEQLNQAKDVAVDFAGEQGLGKIAGQLGSGLGIAAFGTAIAKLFTDSVESASKLETELVKLGSALGPAQAGMARDLKDWLESVSAGMGGVEENMKVFQGLVHLFPVEEAKRMLIDIQNAALQMRIPVDQLGDAIIEMKNLGEVPRGMFREMPELGPLVRAKLPPIIPAPGETPEQVEEKVGAQMKAAAGTGNVADWFIRNVLPTVAPGGLQAGVRIATQETNEAKWDAVAIAFDNMKEEIGGELLPAIKEFADYLKANIPEIGRDLKGFAEALEKLIEFMNSAMKGTGDVFHAAFGGANIEDIRRAREQPANIDWLRTFWNEMTREFQAATSTNRENAMLMNKALNPQ